MICCHQRHPTFDGQPWPCGSAYILCRLVTEMGAILRVLGLYWGVEWGRGGTDGRADWGGEPGHVDEVQVGFRESVTRIPFCHCEYNTANGGYIDVELLATRTRWRVNHVQLLYLTGDYPAEGIYMSQSYSSRLLSPADLDFQWVALHWNQGSSVQDLTPC